MSKRKAILGLVLAGVVFCGIQTGHACSPPPVADLTVTPSNAGIGTTVIFDGNSSYAIGGKTIVKYEWDFDGDGTYDYNEVSPCDGITTYTYTSGGSFTAKLRVTDNRDLTGIDTYPVQVGGVHNITQDLWYSSIQSALDDANDNDEIEVEEGTYYETIDFNGVNCVLRSSDPHYYDVVAGTIIDANGGTAAVTFDDGEDSGAVLQGLTLTGGAYGISCGNSSSPTIEQCVIKGNSDIGIYYFDSAAPVIKNNWIYDNSGVGIFTESTGNAAVIRNNTIVDNAWGGIVAFGTMPAVSNCILWNHDYDLYDCNATYSCIEDGDSGTGNISSYPYFANYNGNDFHLTWNSPCINKGDPNGNYDGEFDIDGNDRVVEDRVDMGADELFDYNIHNSVNLIQNPGFEGGNDAQGVPLYWEDVWKGGTKTLDSTEQHSGTYSWKFVGDASYYFGARSDFIPVAPGNLYVFSVWVKGTASRTIGWEKFDAYNGNSLGYNYFVYNKTESSSGWTNYFTVWQPYDPESAFVKARFFGPSYATGTVWWDDFGIYDLGPEALYSYPYGVSNESNVAETIDFGEDINTNWVKNLTSAMTPYANDSNDINISYRSIKKTKTVIMEFPAFNADGNGFPETPMLLEIMFKDTIQNQVSGVKFTNFVPVYSEVRYVNLDPNYHVNDPNFDCKLISLGGVADNKWKYAQYAFQKSEYQRLQAINNKYIIKITNPYTDAEVPIDYVSLRKITDAEYNAFSDKQRELRGFYEVNLPADVPENPPDYNDLTVYVRDIMRPVYQHTKPAASEIVSDINSTSAWGLVEPVSFAIYSEGGIDNLTVEVSDLVCDQNSIAVIDNSNISVAEVVYSETQLSPTGNKGYALVPEYLKDFTTLSVDAGTSKRIWITIKVPDENANLPGGLYHGTITIKQGENTLKSIGLDLHILDITLDQPEAMNTVDHDPTTKIYSSTSLASVLKLYGESGMEPIIGFGTLPAAFNGRITLARDGQGNIIYDPCTGIADFNTVAFEEALERMRDQGCLADKMHIMINRWFELADVYLAAMGSVYNPSDPDLYFNLSDANFVETFKKLLDTYAEVGNDPNLNVTFIFQVCDEPGLYPDRRIVSDRLYNIIRDGNYPTCVTYYSSCDSPLHINPNEYLIDPNLDCNLPALTNLIDYKLWALGYEDEGYSKHQDPNYYGHDKFGYYTTHHAQMHDPAYNRFLHGLFAFATDAKAIDAYAMGDYVVDPYNDFDADASYVFPFTYPDFLFAYPTWSGKLYPTIGGIEGIREGVKDARYIATLKRLINEGYPNDPNVINAQGYLNDLKAQIDPNLMSGYYDKRTDLGYAQEIYRQISYPEDPNDYESFTEIREKIIDYIIAIDPNP